MMPPSDHNAAVLSPLTCAANLASFQEDEVAWKTARKSVAQMLSLSCHVLTY
jgi:hypothetical protein